MILYVNGDSHTAAAEAVNPYSFANDEQKYFYMGRAPHPDNILMSWGRVLSERLKATFKCDAESASSNDRIMRTTRKWLEEYSGNPKNLLVIIQWSTWEREEWVIDGEYYQITASGKDTVPESVREKYQQFVMDSDANLQNRIALSHEQIWQFHQELEAASIKHVFFNGNSHFRKIPPKDRKEWGASYIGPYYEDSTWDSWLKSQGHETVSPDSWHFGKKAHHAWARFMLQYVISNNLVT